LADELATIRDADAAALRLWLGETQADAEALALDGVVRTTTRELLALADATPRPESALLAAPPLAELRQDLLPQLQALGYDDFVVADRRGRVLAARDDIVVGKVASSDHAGFLRRVLESGASVSRPLPGRVPLPDAAGEERVGVPTMFAAAPVRADDGAAIAVLGLRLRPEGEFTRILQVARYGQTGETYAFDREGRLLSESRFDDDLKRVGLLPDRPDARSILNLELRDPQVNLSIGFRYLRELIDKYDGDERMALLAYNRGPGTVDRVLKRGGNPDNGYAGFVRTGNVGSHRG
jgi:hypothetical protein